MRTCVKLGNGLLALTLIVAMGCGAQVQDMRQQAPLYEIDEDVAVALVSIDIPEWSEVDVDAAESPETLLPRVIPTVFDGSPYQVIDRRGEGFKLAIEPEGDVDYDDNERPIISASKAFTATAPADVPTSIEEPLLLGVQVLDWRESEDHAGVGLQRKVHTDVVYSLWTRDGQKVDTRRVRLDVVPGQNFSGAPMIVPDWPRWMHSAWDGDRHYRPPSATRDEDELFDDAAEVNAMAFAYPYGTREVSYSAPLIDDSELAEGMERMEEKDWAGAYEAFARAVEEHGETDGAHYNMAVAAELQGNDTLALEHFRKAYELNNRGMYQRHMETVERRQDLRINVGEMVAAAEEARQAQIAAEEQASEAEIDDEEEEVTEEEFSEEEEGIH